MKTPKSFLKITFGFPPPPASPYYYLKSYPIYLEYILKLDHLCGIFGKISCFFPWNSKKIGGVGGTLPQKSLKKCL